MFKRELLPQLEAELTTKQAIILTGMRRVGKTTILKYLFDRVPSTNKVLLDLENPLYRKVFEEENYDAIWKNLLQFNIRENEPAFLFLDEVQNLPMISSVAKYFLDHFGTKFFLTGSSSYYLKNLFPESMSGRKLLFELFPLTFGEFLEFKGVNRVTSLTFDEKATSKNEISHSKIAPYFREYLTFGGFPEVVLESDAGRKKQLLEAIFTSYFEKDVKALADFKDLAKMRDLILLLASRVGSKVDVVKLSSSLGLSRETVYNYLEFLEKSYFIKLLPKHSGSVDRRVSGGKKVFLCDSGLTSFLKSVSDGQLLEEAIFETLRPTFDLAYYDKGGHSEIDFVLDGSVGLEVKTTASLQDVRSLSLRSNQANLTKSYLVSQDYTTLPEAILATDL